MNLKYICLKVLKKIVFLGTRIVYDRTFLLKYRSSELGKTPPTNLPEIPGVTVPEKKHSEVKEEATPRASGKLLF